VLFVQDDVDVRVHVVAVAVQTPFASSHAYPVGHALVALHEGVHAPPTHADPAVHCVASAHWSLGATQDPVRHFAPAVVHSLSPEHEDVMPTVAPISSHAGAPFESLQT
jgi:hypothetical protein